MNAASIEPSDGLGKRRLSWCLCYRSLLLSECVVASWRCYTPCSSGMSRHPVVCDALLVAIGTKYRAAEAVDA